jgi:hypothetical protein
MITVVDKANGHVVQKVTKPDGKLVRYQLVPEIAGDSASVKVFATLTSARAALSGFIGGKQVV